MFYLRNNYEQPSINSVTLYINYQQIRFEKKYMLSLVFLLYLLSKNRPYFQTSKKNLINYRIRKGDIIGTKVSLRSSEFNKLADNYNTFNLKNSFEKLRKKKFFAKTQQEYINTFFKLSAKKIILSKFLNLSQKFNAVFSFSTKTPHRKRFLLNLYLNQN